MLDRAGISPEVAKARPYYSLTDEAREHLVEQWGFAYRQLEGEGLVIPRYRPNGREAPPQVRHDMPRRSQDGSFCKYDSPKGSGGVIDVHPLIRGRLDEVAVPLWVPESVKGADALVSRGHLAIGFQGVWGWCSNQIPSRYWEDIKLYGRRVIVAFDSDVADPKKSKPSSPCAALRKFVEYLRLRGADVHVAVIPNPAGGEKQGIDDWLGGRAI